MQTCLILAMEVLYSGVAVMEYTYSTEHLQEQEGHQKSVVAQALFITHLKKNLDPKFG